MAMPTSFHGYYDLNVRSYQIYTGGGKWIPPINWYITIRDRSLNYEFFPHFHPYVPPLIQRVNDGGIAELQDSDTLYLPQPNPPNGQPLQPLTVLPNSTRATLSTNVPGTRPADGTSVSLSAGTPVTLSVGTTVTIPAGTTVSLLDGTTSKLLADASESLPGQIPVSSSSGIQWSIAGSDTIVLDNTAVTLPNGAQAVLMGDGTTVNLPNGTAVAIRSGMPQPFFYEEFFARYGPDAQWVQKPYPVKNIDFTFDGAYSIYNWELFFHAPLLIAVHLSQNQKFKDAQKWFHYIFNPTDNSPGPTPERFWKVQPLQYTDVRMIEQILVNLSTNQDPELWKQTDDSIKNWRQNPFQPFAVAKFRPTAYMLKTVMAYTDNLIAWGDSLFQQYTIETINEATQLYVMAANIWGRKPQAVPKKGSVKPLTYNDLRGKLDDFGNTMVDMEVDIPFDIAPLPGQETNPRGTQMLGSIGQSLYFCIPRNDKLLGYWDTIADRLFKIHNSLNLQGVFQKLPLYEPPIDPALLVRAAAAGLDVSAIVNGLNQPLPLVRFQLLVSKAAEICQEVQALGAHILAATEKQDNESVSLLRAQHESTILGLAEMVKYSQVQDATKARQGLEQSFANASQRYTYYQKLLGGTDVQIKTSIPQLDAFDRGSLQNLTFSQADESGEPQMPLDPITPNIAGDSTSVSDGEIKTLSNHEVEELNKLALSRDAQLTASVLEAVGSGLAIIPQFGVHAQPMGVGVTAGFGGQQLHDMTSALAAVARAFAEEYSYEANKTSKLGSYSRRELEWLFQSNSAKGEINQIFKQLRGAQIREAIAQKEFDNHQKQMLQAQQIVDFLQGNETNGGFLVKETTIGFYAWMKREVKALYAKAFQLGFEVAKKAERALQHELGAPNISYIQYNYLDGTEGLLAGEKLMFDVKAMEMAYHDLNQREYELTKHISLLQVHPLALMQLRATGSCSFTLPEEAFDMDFPAHFRRIKSVAVTLPCVTGPYTSVNCALTLQNSSIRTSTDVADGYARKGSDDPRFNDYYGTLQSIVTSSAQSDSGLFETNLRDERYLPFEGAGIAGSQWQLSLPADVRQFDFDTITDVILHVRYTAREAGDAFKAAAVQNLQSQISKAQTVGSVRLFSVRHEFPSEWAKFQSVTLGGPMLPGLSLTLRPEHYPFWAQGIVGSAPLIAAELFAEMTDATVSVNLYEKPDKTGPGPDTLSQNPLLGNLLSGTLAKIPLPASVTDATHPPLTLYFDDNSMEELWLAIRWGGKS
jgi:hypothetical protein